VLRGIRPPDVWGYVAVLVVVANLDLGRVGDFRDLPHCLDGAAYRWRRWTPGERRPRAGSVGQV